MNRIITYSIASSAGLLIAALLSIPTLRSVKEWERTHAAPPPAAAVLDVQPTPAAPTAPVENQTILEADITSGMLTVTVNGEPAGSLQGPAKLDISRFCKPGANTVRLMWVGPTQGEVHAMHTSAGVVREVGSAFLVPADTETAGLRELAVYL
jgi:hypothetical protein